MARNLLHFFFTTAFFMSCSFTQKIKNGTMAYELKQYAVATEMLRKEFQQTNDSQIKGQLAYQLGESFRMMGEVEQAIPWYSKAIQNNYGIRAKHRMAFTLKQIQRYSEAINLFRELVREGSSSELYQREIAICRLASEWIKEQARFEIEPSLFNSRTSDYSPVFLDDHRIFFSSDRENTTSQKDYKWTGGYFSDIYMYNLITGEISHLDPAINSPFNEGTIAFNDDGTILFFTRCYSDSEYDDYCRILQSSYIDGNWNEPIDLPFMKEGVNYGHPFWSEKDSVLFFSSEQEGGFGGFDLYFSQLDRNGNWSSPKNLGPVINSDGDDKFPSLKNDTLFFASTGHPGMGGLDIFYTYIENGIWQRPFNMKYPINSGSDDFAITFLPSKDGNLNEGYFTTSRKGSDDIFGFKPKIIDIDVKEEPKENPGDVALKMAVTVMAEDEFGNKAPLPQAKLEINGIAEKLNPRSFILKDIESGEYAISVHYPGYFSMKHLINAQLSDVPLGKTEYTYNKTLILKPIVKDKEIVLENILYDFNEFFIREDAKPSLIELASLLTENPEISIELSSHTDCVGPNSYNMDLSQKRAQSAVDFIINLGISEERIVARGYGETRPKADCDCSDCTKDQHQTNRRTSFKII